MKSERRSIFLFRRVFFTRTGTTSLENALRSRDQIT
jgi:hypothetical protein